MTATGARHGADGGLGVQAHGVGGDLEGHGTIVVVVLHDGLGGDGHGSFGSMGSQLIVVVLKVTVVIGAGG